MKEELGDCRSTGAVRVFGLWVRRLSMPSIATWSPRVLRVYDYTESSEVATESL